MTSGRRIGVEREIAALLDQRARQRLGEDALGQAERERLALALVAALVMGDQRHRHFGAGPGMIGQILDGLADAVPGARLRQHQREIRRPVQRTRRGGLPPPASSLAREGRLRFGHAVIVFELVGQQQRAAVLLLGILGQRDGRRLVGNGVERPDQIVAGAAQRRRAGRRDREAMLLGAGRRAGTSSVAGVTPPVPATSRSTLPVERTISVESDRHRDRTFGLQRRGLAGMDARQHDRRPAGIGRRRHPGIDAEIRRQHHALPVERRRDPLPALAAGGKESRDAGDQHQRAQRIGIAPRKPRRRRSRL